MSKKKKTEKDKVMEFIKKENDFIVKNSLSKKKDGKDMDFDDTLKKILKVPPPKRNK